MNRTVDEHTIRRAALRFVELASALEGGNDGIEGENSPDGIAELANCLHVILELTPIDHQHSRHLVELVSSMRKIVMDLSRSCRPSGDICELTRLHGEALLASLRGTDDARRQVVAVLNRARDVVNVRATQEVAVPA